jgi:hypothetical protein
VEVSAKDLKTVNSVFITALEVGKVFFEKKVEN